MSIEAKQEIWKSMQGMSKEDMFAVFKLMPWINPMTPNGNKADNRFKLDLKIKTTEY